jgi:2-dehydro-3-deoxygluconokinase
MPNHRFPHCMGGSPGRVVCFGEAMLRHSPAPEGWAGRTVMLDGSPHAETPGGAEYNVACALSRLGGEATWVSAVPEAGASEVLEPARSAGVNLELVESAHPLGTYRVIPKAATVEYDRSDSAFAHLEPGTIDWRAQLSGARWLVVSGITPLLGEGPLANWSAALTFAELEGTLVALDLNHRPQLGTFEELWAKVEPRLRQMHMLVLSPSALETMAGEASGRAVEGLRKRWNLPYVACTWKQDLGDGCQSRWSAMAHPLGFASTEARPVTHNPVESLGGGDAWLAGVVDGLIGGLEAEAACHRGDLLAALTQRTFGDLGEVTREQLSRLESIEGRCDVTGTG